MMALPRWGEGAVARRRASAEDRDRAARAPIPEDRVYENLRRLQPALPIRPVLPFPLLGKSVKGNV